MRRENRRDERDRRAGRLIASLLACACVAACVAIATANSGPLRVVAREGGRKTSGEGEDAVARAAEAVCAERKLDPRASVPIDVMQARANLSARNRKVLAGAARATQLLAAAKQLAAESLSELMREGGVSASARRMALVRIEAVRRIKLEVPLRDNASVVYGDPRTIRFGTIFIASLPSDEGLVSVMAHELTHAADGARGSLAVLFRRVGRRAEAAAGLGHISARRAEELTCDLVGVMATRLYIARHATQEPMPLRAARSLEHNCVEHDETDAEHLSPRQTLRAVLALTPALAAEVTGEADAGDASAPLNHSQPLPRRDDDERGARHQPPRRRPRAAP